MRRIISRYFVAGSSAIALWLAAPATALADGAPEPGADRETEVSAASEGQEEQVQEEVARQWAERRKAMLEEAQAALDETHAALIALENGKKQEAIEALARATGKLELLVAREPTLALAPVDVRVVTYDLYATPESIRSALEEVERLPDDGRIQNARAILSGLGSEVIISVRNLPLGSYPDAIKAVSPLIDEGKVDEARAALRAALNTLVVSSDVISLPALRASAMLEEAEELLNSEQPETEVAAQEQRESGGEGRFQRVERLVDAARRQVEMAELLGYGSEGEHESFRGQIAELEKKLRGEQETEGLFAQLQRALASFQTSFFD